MTAPLLRMTGIDKSFGAQRVLRGVDFELQAGAVHVLAGENGAGKSTLIRILGGVHTADAGAIEIAGRPVRFRSPREAFAAGVAIIHQELSLVPSLSVAENVLLGRERSRLGWLLSRREHHHVREALEQLGVDVDVRTPVEACPIGVRQQIEIAKALTADARILVMDEPTSALREPEVERLLAIIAGLKARGCGVIYITHRLEEVYRLADTITVLRDGQRVACGPPARMSPQCLVRNMVGRELPAVEERREPPSHRVRLELKELTIHGPTRASRRIVDGVSFCVRAGEIVGLAGLEGCGARALLAALFGANAGRVTGRVLLDGRPYHPSHPRRAIRRGLALVTSDRQRTGLIADMSVAANLTLPMLPRLCRAGWIPRSRELSTAQRIATELDLRARSLLQAVATLSGGNQQKVVLGKWLHPAPGVFLLDEPTRGVDVGAKQEIYALLHRWRQNGMAILLITSELPELLMLADRILVMYRGRIVAGFPRDQASSQRVLHAAMGGAA